MEWSMGIKYRVNEQDSEVGEFKPTLELRDEQNCYKVFYQDIGLQPFDVPEGGEFFIFQNMMQRNHTHHIYGDGGNPEWYNTFEENQPDFDTKHPSPYSSNGTDNNRG
jgi:hypothetical protein